LVGIGRVHQPDCILFVRSGSTVLIMTLMRKTQTMPSNLPKNNFIFINIEVRL
jgi:hypothetical protein